MKKKFAFYTTITIYFWAAIMMAAFGQKRSYLLALSKGDHTLAVVDPHSYEVLTQIPVGEDPHEVISSADGNIAYVSIYGGGGLHTINVVDLIARKRLEDIDMRPLFGPHGLTYVHNNLWFTAEGSKAVGRYDPVLQKIDWAMGTGQDRTHMIFVTDDGENIYTSNVASGTISILSGIPRDARADKNWEQTIVPVGRGSEGFDVSPEGIEMWTASAQNGKIYIIDLKYKKVTQTIDAKVNGANRLKFSPDGKLVFISSLSLGFVTVFDRNTRKEIKKIEVGNGAAGIVIAPDGTHAFVACSPDNYVAVIDIKTLSVTKKINVGKQPDGLAWAVEP